MSEPNKAAMWALRVAALVAGYLAITLAAATLATPAPGDVLGAAGRKLVAPLAAALPGTGLWGSLIDLHGKIGGTLPTSIVVMATLVALASGAWAWAGKINKQIRSEAATAHDEAIRLRVRAKARG